MEHYYRAFLTNELEKRRRTNSRYSLRAFARDLKVDSGALSRILSGRQSLSIKLAINILESLPHNAMTREQFLGSVMEEQKQLLMARINNTIVNRYPAAKSPTVIS